MRFACPACGYLRGLERGESAHAEVRCPNCGTGFVPALLDMPAGEPAEPTARAPSEAAADLRSIRSNINLLVAIVVLLVLCGCCGGALALLF